MKRRTLATLMLLVMAVVVLALPACITSTDDEEKTPVEEPSEPPDQPPPPPPPPPGISDPVILPTIEEIAGNVLQGHYGPELQQLLADEISICLSMMVESGMISVSSSPSAIELDRIESESTEVLYGDRYLVEWILDGQYGETAKSNLLVFIRSFDGN